MRGKEPDTIITELTDGITPAYAGKRVPRVYGPSVPGDHPRVCGEKPGGRLRELVYPGSPPRVRGKVKDSLLDCPQSGITPACAGKSLSMQLVLALSGDHPRVCGEKYPVMDDAFIDMGSPPRVRGKAKNRCRSCPLTRITPAYAGKRAGCPIWGCTGWDHPRVCGEKVCRSFACSGVMGSPPRMRGKV